MRKNNQLVIRGILLALFDIAAVYFSLWIGLVLRFNSFEIGTYSIGLIIVGLIYTSAIVILYILFGLYRSLWRYASVEELVKLILASIIVAITVFLLNYVIGRPLPNSTFAISLLLQTSISGGLRFSYRVARVIKNSIKGNSDDSGNRNRVIIIGSGYEAVAVIKSYSEGNLNGKVVAIIDRFNSVGTMIKGITIKGKLQDLEQIINETNANEVIISSENFTKEDIAFTLGICAKTNCRLMKNKLLDRTKGRTNVVDIDPTDLLGRAQVDLNCGEITKFIESKTILVTGGGGSIGSELVKQLIKFHPKRIIIFDIYENYAYLTKMELADTYPDIQIEVEIGSIRDEKRVEAIFSLYRPNIVFHAAAHKHVPLMEKSPSEALKNNVVGTYVVCNISAKYNTDKFVLISTDKAVNPTNVMGASKRVSELIISAFNNSSQTEFSAVRFGNVLGSSGSVVPIFKQQILSGGPVKITHPEITRYFMTIPEACQLVIQAGMIAKGGEIFILDMGSPVRISELAESMIMMYGMTPHQDIKIEYVGLRPGEKLYEELMLKGESKKTNHEKIFIAQTVPCSRDQVRHYLNEIKYVINNSPDLESVNKVLKKIVPEFTPDEEN